MRTPFAVPPLGARDKHVRSGRGRQAADLEVVGPVSGRGPSRPLSERRATAEAGGALDVPKPERNGALKRRGPFSKRGGKQLFSKAPVSSTKWECFERNAF
jgi:hypothetical protein